MITKSSRDDEAVEVAPLQRSSRGGWALEIEELQSSSMSSLRSISVWALPVALLYLADKLLAAAAQLVRPLACPFPVQAVCIGSLACCDWLLNATCLALHSGRWASPSRLPSSAWRRSWLCYWRLAAGTHQQLRQPWRSFGLEWTG